MREHGERRRRVIIVGAVSDAVKLRSMLPFNKLEMYDVIGCVETTSGALRGREEDGLYVLGLVSDLEDVLNEYAVDVVLMVGSSLPYSKILSLGGRFGPLRRPDFKIVPELPTSASGASLTMFDILPGRMFGAKRST